MKKLHLLWLILFISSASIQAQDLNKFFKKYASDDRFESISVGKTLIKFASIFSDVNPDDFQIFSKMKQIKVLKITEQENNEAIFQSFQKDMEKLTKCDCFDTLATTRTKNKSTNIISRTAKDNNTDVLIISNDKKTLSIIWLNGKISKEELEKIVNEDD